MEVATERSDTLMHLSGYIFKAAIHATLRGKGRFFRTTKRDRIEQAIGHKEGFYHTIFSQGQDNAG
jgi:hypothetical protein